MPGYYRRTWSSTSTPPLPFFNASPTPFHTVYFDRIEHDQAAEAFAAVNILHPRALGIELPDELVQMIYLMAIHE